MILGITLVQIPENETKETLDRYCHKFQNIYVKCVSFLKFDVVHDCKISRSNVTYDVEIEISVQKRNW